MQINSRKNISRRENIMSQLFLDQQNNQTVMLKLKFRAKSFVAVLKVCPQTPLTSQVNKTRSGYVDRLHYELPWVPKNECSWFLGAGKTTRHWTLQSVRGELWCETSFQPYQPLFVMWAVYRSLPLYLPADSFGLAKFFGTNDSELRWRIDISGAEIHEPVTESLTMLLGNCWVLASQYIRAIFKASEYHSAEV